MSRSKLFEDVCNLGEILSLSKCGPYFDSSQSLSIDTRDKPLYVHYLETYFPFKKSYFSIGLTTTITFYDFDENEIEHQKMLKLALTKLQSTFSRLGLKVFYKRKLMAYNSPPTLQIGNERYLFNQYLISLYRETIGNLLELEFTKHHFSEFDVCAKEDSKIIHYGRLLFSIQDGFEDKQKEHEIKRRLKLLENVAKDNKFSEEKIKRCKEDIFNPINYQERKLLIINLFQKFNLIEEEFQELKKIIDKYNLEIYISDSRKSCQHKNFTLPMNELKELLVE